MKKHEIKELVDWHSVLKADRFAGGHEEVMRAIFGSSAKVIAEWIEDDYQGEEAFAYQFHDGRVVIMTDYFGSCSGCDSWDDADDEDVILMVGSLVNSARVFKTIKDAICFCENVEDEGTDYPFRCAVNLVPLLKAIN